MSRGVHPDAVRGPVVLGIEGRELTPGDRARLADPRVGGVILFARNFVSSAQLRQLTASIRALRSALLIAVDHEGGRVQRFRSDEFTPLPPMRSLGERWDADPVAARAAAFATGETIARELLAHGVDFSFTPVLDLDYAASRVIGDRAFHADPVIVASRRIRTSTRRWMTARSTRSSALTSCHSRR